MKKLLFGKRNLPVALSLLLLTASCVEGAAIPRLTAEDVYVSIIQKGLEAANPLLIQDNELFQRGISCRAVIFSLPTYKNNSSENIYECQTMDMLNKLVLYIIAADNYRSWLMVKSNVLLRMDGGLQLEFVQRYADAIPGDGNASILPPNTVHIPMAPTDEVTNPIPVPSNTLEIIPTAAPMILPTVTSMPVSSPTPICNPSYPDVCLLNGAGDYDCSGGTGDGPNYVQGPVRVLPPDPFELDRDHDGWGCN